MKICAAQTRPIKGNIKDNIDAHKKLVGMAINHGTDTIIFPELSLTGYEPELAKELAIHQNDSILDEFQEISDTNKITVGVGAPTKNDDEISISTIIFQPFKARKTYSKQYLHPDEEHFFVRGENFEFLIGNNKISLAICYELSVPQHSEHAFNNGAEIYIVSAVKSKSQVRKAIEILSETANKYSMTVLMANCVGDSGGYECAGKTSIWNKDGLLVGQLNDQNEGIIIIDTETQKITSEIL